MIVPGATECRGRVTAAATWRNADRVRMRIVTEIVKCVRGRLHHPRQRLAANTAHALRAGNDARVIAEAHRGVCVLVLDGLPVFPFEREQLLFDVLRVIFFLPNVAFVSFSNAAGGCRTSGVRTAHATCRRHAGTNACDRLIADPQGAAFYIIQLAIPLATQRNAGHGGDGQMSHVQSAPRSDRRHDDNFTPLHRTREAAFRFFSAFSSQRRSADQARQALHRLLADTSLVRQDMRMQ